MGKKKSDQIVYKRESSAPVTAAENRKWKILITDDESSVHKITVKALSDFTFMGKGLVFLHAYSGNEAAELMKAHPDTALVFLDIVLETNNAGLDLIHHIRRTLNNSITQIVVRTGEPAHAPEQNLIEAYEINDYRLKTELTVRRLHTVTTASLRTFHIKSNLQRELDEKRIVERSLRESERRFRDIAHSIGDLIWEIDTRGRYTYISKNAQTTLGYPPEQLLGTGFTSQIDDPDPDTLTEIKEAMAGTTPFTNLEIWKIKKNGNTACFLSSGKPIKDDNGVVTGYRGVDKEITDLKSAEKEKESLMLQLRQTQRLESLGILAGGIAHDFNNILGAILGYAQLLRLDIKDNPKAKRYTGMILESCDRAKKLIFQILDFSRHNKPDTGKSAISPAVVTKETIKLLRASLPSSVRIKTRIPEAEGAILADPGQLRQVITNLCTNSFHAMEKGHGTITITVRNVNIHPDHFIPAPGFDLAFGEYTAISVKDDGIGMEEATREKIFEPYFSTRRGGDGTGLGLSVVRGIVTQCKGYILTKSAAGKGTEQILFFPTYEKRRQTAIPNGIPMGKGRGKVMFIDDEQMLVDLGRSMLERLGYDAVALKSPLEALETITKDPHAFDAVITDLTMPDLQGNQLADKIKNIRPDLPVVLVTGLSSIAASKKTNASGIDALLSKPLSMNSLAQTMTTLVKKQ
ncbi:MAG: response regulator [Desulfobacteraceae bacterium]|nr:response regulator [Desulfobacteraceae bacterium]